MRAVCSTAHTTVNLTQLHYAVIREANEMRSTIGQELIASVLASQCCWVSLPRVRNIAQVFMRGEEKEGTPMVESAGHISLIKKQLHC